jgi:AraC-like DNA-binding protein
MQLIIEIINIILLIGIIQGVIFTGIIFKIKSKHKSILFLGLIIFFLSLNNLQAWLVEKNLIKINYYISYLHVSWNIFLAPMFYLFLTNYLRIEKTTNNILSITILIFIVTILIRLIALNYIRPQFESNEFYSFLRKHNSFEDIFVFLYTIPIFIASVYLFFKRKDKFTFVLSYDNLKWIKIFFILCSIILSFWLVAIYLNYYYNKTNSTLFYLPLRFGTSFLIYWLGYQGFNHHKLLQDRILLRKEIENSKQSLILDVNLNNSFSESDFKDFENLKQHILKNKSFLDPYLSLTSLANKYNTNTSYLSKIINNYSAYNFTDYINSYRVTYAKELLTNKKYKSYTIIAIGLESGFNSKSTFYTAFKKLTQQTPSEFRQTQNN